MKSVTLKSHRAIRGGGRRNAVPVGRHRLGSRRRRAGLERDRCGAADRGAARPCACHGGDAWRGARCDQRDRAAATKRIASRSRLPQALRKTPLWRAPRTVSSPRSCRRRRPRWTPHSPSRWRRSATSARKPTASRSARPWPSACWPGAPRTTSTRKPRTSRAPGPECGSERRLGSRRARCRNWAASRPSCSSRSISSPRRAGPR